MRAFPVMTAPRFPLEKSYSALIGFALLPRRSTRTWHASIHYMHKQTVLATGRLTSNSQLLGGKDHGNADRAPYPWRDDRGGKLRGELGRPFAVLVKAANALGCELGIWLK